jgi:hypothetical protein
MKTLALFLLNRALSLFLGELWLFLRETVATYERLDLHPAQKRAMVYELALNHARGAGLSISDSLLNLGIEAALQTVRDRAH